MINPNGDLMISTPNISVLPSYDELYKVGSIYTSTGNGFFITSETVPESYKLPTYKETTKMDKRKDDIFVIFDYDEKTTKNQLSSISRLYHNNAEQVLLSGGSAIVVSSDDVVATSNNADDTNGHCYAKWCFAVMILTIMLLMVFL